MKHIIIDTNVIHLDYQLNKSRITSLCSTCAALDHTIYIPDVVVDEFVRQYKEEVVACVEQYNQALHKMQRRAVPITLASLDADLLTANYEATIRARIATLGIRIIPYPKTDHKEMVARELSHRKPFLDSTKGYRDSLIWESIKEHCKTTPKTIEIVFLSENSDDFAEKSKKTFHQDLLVDCDKEGLDKDQLTLVTDVHEYINKEIIGKSKALQELLSELQKSNGIGDIDVMQEVKDYIDVTTISNYITDDPYDECISYIPGFYENPEVTNIETTSIRFDSIHEISDDEIVIRCTVDIEAEIDVYIYHGDMALIDDNSQPYIFDYDWNEHYAAASDSATFKLQLNIVCDKKLTKVLSIDDEFLLVDYETGYHYEA